MGKNYLCVIVCAINLAKSFGQGHLRHIHDVTTA